MSRDDRWIIDVKVRIYDDTIGRPKTRKICLMSPSVHTLKAF
jgi:hypothetical protein